MSRPAQNYEFQEWWNRERAKADGLLPSPDSPFKPPRVSGRSHRLLLLLRLRRCSSSAASRALSLLLAAGRRLSSPFADRADSRLYRLIRSFLALAICLLLLELAAFAKGWHFVPPSVAAPAEALERLYATWLLIRARYLAPPVQLLANMCIVLFLIQTLDRLALTLACIWIRIRRLRPVHAVEYSESEGDVETASLAAAGEDYYPMVLLQIPMCNEREEYELASIIKVKLIKLMLNELECFRVGEVSLETTPMLLSRVHATSCDSPVPNHMLSTSPLSSTDLTRRVYQQSVAAVCVQDWPREKMLVQVLDDSDEIDLQNLIKLEVQKWQQQGVQIVYRHRLIRTGYKAGNLKSAMSCDYVKDYEFVAIFDADFQPAPDFLKRTIPHFKGDDNLALVQTRWAFVNKDENLLTRLQNINLSFHFEVEQQVNGMLINFFGFNGTAGVWRIKALEESGGWLERTTVEDMDIAVRAHLCGWKFIYLNDVECLCELPESYEAYKKQQHRWHSGPMQLFRLCFVDILRSKVSMPKKANLIFLFFLLRKLILPFYSFTLFCIILPLTMFLPEAQLPAWVVCYVPGIMSIINILPAPRSFPFIVPYLLFENTMSVTKFNAMISGLFKFGSSYEWIVTKKSGRSSEADLVAFVEKESDPQAESRGLHRASSESGLAELNRMEITKKAGKPKINRLYRKELTLAFILLTASARSLLSAQGIHFYFLLFQGITFLVVGLDLIGEQVG